MKTGIQPDQLELENTMETSFVVQFRITRLVATSALAVAWWMSPVFAAPRSAEAQGLRIIVLDGEDGVNIIKKKTAVKPVVEVRDRNDLPVAGALVVFLLPHGGPSAQFANGQRELTVTSDANGRAVASAMKPIGKGSFRIAVRVSFQGQTATTTIAQSNFMTLAAAQAAGHAAGSASAGSAGGSAAGGTAAASGAVSGASAGLSTGAIVAIAGGVAVAGGVAGVVATQSKSSAPKDCNSILNQATSDLNTEGQVCSSGTFSQCQASAQTVFNTVGQYCSCAGGGGGIPADQITFLDNLAQELGITLPSSCGF